MVLAPNRRLISFWPLQVAGWGVYFVVIYITFMTIAPPGSALHLLAFKAFRALSGFVLTSVVLRPLYRRFGTDLSIGVLVLFVLGVATALGVVWTAIEFVYVQRVSFAPNVPGYLARSPRIALDYAMTLAAWSALYLGVRFWREWQHARERAAEAAALMQAAHLQMLRYQLNPHFLFNTLNSIRALIDEDAKRAQLMITQLAELMRHSLLGEREATIRLAEEFDAVTRYLEIEKVRFEEQLEFECDIDAAARQVRVPGFLLNPLVENAIKHGRRTSPPPLRVRLSARVRAGRLILEVMNSGTLGRPSLDDDNGIGLKNVRQRLSNLFGAKGRFELRQEDEWVSARIDIPADPHGGPSGRPSHTRN